MSQLTAAQRAWQARFETVIRIASPGLDLLLAAGDRLSRLVGGEDEWEPPPGLRDPGRLAGAPRPGNRPSGRS